MTALLIVGFLLIWAIELPGMLHRRHMGEIVAFAVIWVLGLTFSLFVLYDIPVAHDMTLFLREVFEPIGKKVIAPPE